MEVAAIISCLLVVFLVGYAVGARTAYERGRAAGKAEVNRYARSTAVRS